MRIFRRKDQSPVEPSEEAKLARAFADHLVERADTVLNEREYLVHKRNHFAERIRLSYEGR